MRQDVNDSFDRALEMISMVEELLEKDLNKELSTKANQGLSATLKIARDMLKNSGTNKSHLQEYNYDQIKEDIEPSLAYNTNSSNNFEKPSRRNRRSPVIHMTRKALNLG